jgi:hypothetical protein
MRRAWAAFVVLAASCGGDEAPGATAADAHAAAPSATDDGAALPAAANARPGSPRAARPAEPEPFSLATSEPPPLPGTARGLADALAAEPEGPRAIETMRALESLGADALPELIRLTKVPELAGWACSLIGAIGRTTPGAQSEAAAAIVACVRRFGDVVRAEWPLSRLGDAGLAAAQSLVEDADPSFRRVGLQAFHGAARVPPAAVPALLRAATDPSAGVREDVATALRWVEEFDDSTRAALLDLARSGDRWVQMEALDSIRARADDFSEQAPAVLRIAEAGGPNVDWAVSALVHMGPDASLLGLASSVRDVRCEAAERADPADDRVRDRLIVLLRDDDTSVREASLGSLARLDDPPAEAGAAATEILRSASSAGTRAAAATVAGRLLANDRSLFDPLVAALADPQPEVRTAAAVALASSCGAGDRARVLALLRPIWERDDVPGMLLGLRVEVAAAAGALDGEGTPTVAFVARVATSTGDADAFRALARIGTRDAVTELLSWLDSRRWEQRDHAVRALGDVRTPDDQIVPALLRELQEGRNAEARALAARALTRHASDAKVRAALESAVRSSSRSLADAAMEALGGAETGAPDGRR